MHSEDGVMDEETLVRTLSKVLDERNRIDSETHRSHHDYVSRLIDRDKKRSEMWHRVKGHVIGWGLVSGITGFIYLLGDTMRELVRGWLKIKGGQ